MKIFLVLVAVIGLAVLGVKWFSGKDAEIRQKEEAIATATPVPQPPKPTPWARSSLDNPRQAQGSTLDRMAPPSKGYVPPATPRPSGFGSGTALDRPAYK